MYLATLLNQYGLFQRTSDWKHQTGQGNESDISAFLYRATSSYVHLMRIHELNRLCIEEFELFEDQLQINDSKIIFYSTILVNLLNEISPLLSGLRIMQDLIFPLLGKELKIHTPISMKDGVKRIDKYKIPQNIQNLILRYWQNSGQHIRSYRDIDQHYHNLVQHVFFQVDPDKKVLILFPDNPNEKASNNFTYTRGIDAIHLLESAFNDIHNLVENIAANLGYLPRNHGTEIRMSHLGELVPPRERTLALQVEKYVKQIDGNDFVTEISGLKVNQLNDMRLSVQRLTIGEDKLNKQ